MQQYNKAMEETKDVMNDVTKENIKEDNPNWPQIPDHLYKILIIGGSGSEKQIHLIH